MANLFEGIKYARFLSIAAGYQPLLAIMEGLIKMIPGMAKAKIEHEAFCSEKTQTRLDTKTERKDFMSYVRPADMQLSSSQMRTDLYRF